MGEVVLFQAQQVPAQLGALPPPMLACVVIQPDKQAYRGGPEHQSDLSHSHMNSRSTFQKIMMIGSLGSIPQSLLSLVLALPKARSMASSTLLRRSASSARCRYPGAALPRNC